MSGVTIVKELDYEITFKKPSKDHENTGYTLAAVLNIGWCHTQHVYPWIRIGDFLSVKQHLIKLKEDMDGYVKDIYIDCYGRFLLLLLD